MSYDVSVPRGTTIANLSASAPDGSGFTPAARPVTPVKSPSFKAPKTIGKKPAVIAKGKKVTAGGPGSGRHGAEGVLAKHGWSVTKEGTNSTQYKHPDLPGHRIVVNNNSGNWSHNDVHSPDEVDSGKTAKELDDHLIGK